jgi:hypothetical protein
MNETLLSGGVGTSPAGEVSNNECGEKKSEMGTDHRTNPSPAQSLWDIAPDEAMQFWTNDIYDQCAGEEDL